MAQAPLTDMWKIQTNHRRIFGMQGEFVIFFSTSDVGEITNVNWRDDDASGDLIVYDVFVNGERRIAHERNYGKTWMLYDTWNALSDSVNSLILFNTM